MAFLLPLLTALSGMWLLRFLFSALNPPRPLPEQMAHGLGLGMMAVAAITLGVKLCGLHGRGLVFLLTAVGGIAEIWYNRNAYLSGTTSGFRKAVRHPVVLAILVAGLFVFAILFRLAGLQGLIDYDAVMAVSLKAKIIHLYTGSGWYNGFPIRVWRMRIPTTPRFSLRCKQPRMTHSDMWMNLSPSSGPPGCCCFSWPPWPR